MGLSSNRLVQFWQDSHIAWFAKMLIWKWDASFNDVYCRISVQGSVNASWLDKFSVCTIGFCCGMSVLATTSNILDHYIYYITAVQHHSQVPSPYALTEDSYKRLPKCHYSCKSIQWPHLHRFKEQRLNNNDYQQCKAILRDFNQSGM